MSRSARGDGSSKVIRSIAIESESNNQIAPPPHPPERPYVAEEETPEFSPHMLAELEDELARSRMREDFWISVIVHIALVLLVIFSPQWLPNWAQPHLLRAEDLIHAKQPTFLTLPEDALKSSERVHADKLSDKNRIAQTQHPIDRKTLEELRSRGNQMAPGPAAPSTPQPAMPQPAPQPPPANSQSAMNVPPQRIQPQSPPRENPFKMPGSAGDVISQAARNAPHLGSGGGGGYGMGSADHRTRLGSTEILNDTEGVDFGPYLARIHRPTQINWMNLEPEAVRPPLLKHGKVSIRFFIMRDGTVNGMSILSSSGDIAMDRAAWGGITASSPYPPLPREFHGPYLELLFTFFYNPTTGEMEQLQ